MVRVPAKSCPNLSRLFESAEPVLMTGFFNSRSFERLKWLKDYRTSLNGQANEMLRKETKERLGPLETEAARIVTMASTRGQFALEGIAGTKLASDRQKMLISQRDELSRSLWAYTQEPLLFEAAENSLHMQLYRRFDRHYQTFAAEPSLGTRQEAEAELVKRFLDKVEASLNRGEGYSIDRFDIPGDGDMPPAELYMLFHPNPSTSVKEIDDDGNRARIYFRPPGEAMIVYFPSTGRVHVRAGTRALRHQIAGSFIETVLEQPLSSQPVDFQAYDIRQFRRFVELSRPAFTDVVIQTARVIRIEVSIKDLGSRLSVSTTAEGDLKEIVETQSGLKRSLRTPSPRGWSNSL